MILTQLKVALAATILAISTFTNVANAGLVSFTEVQEQTSDYQDFVFDFTDVDWAENTSAELYLEVQADLGFVTETLDITLDTLNLGTYGGFSNLLNGWSHIAGGNIGAVIHPDAWRVSNTFTISALDMQSIATDGLIYLNVDFSDKVNVIAGDIDGIAPYVKAVFTYQAVPEPTTAVLMLVAMFGLVGRRLTK